MIKADIKAGICNMRTTVEAAAPDGMNVQLRIESDCPQIRALASELEAVDAYQELFKPQNKTHILELASKCKLHTTCPVPIGLLKAIEAAAHLALPADSHILLAQDDSNT